MIVRTRISALKLRNATHLRSCWALLEKAEQGDWWFGRHTNGSNFFRYILDLGGPWFEYYSDMDHICDWFLWTPTNHGMKASLAKWGPAAPKGFVNNYELDPYGLAHPALDREPASPW